MIHQFAGCHTEVMSKGCLRHDGVEGITSWVEPGDKFERCREELAWVKEERENVDNESTAIVVRLSYVGTGWRTFGDALLANTAADQARKRRDTARDALAEFIDSGPGLRAA
jgi:hypothetical protein